MQLKKGFTLVELLVVISIIAVLLAILIPSLQQARMQAKMIVCATYQRNVITAVTCYMSEYNNKLPPTIQGLCFNNVSAKSDPRWWTLPIRLKYHYHDVSSTRSNGLNGGSLTDILGRYMKNASYFSCPVANDNIKWQDRYLTGDRKDQRVDMLDCSYMLFWNYLGYYKTINYSGRTVKAQEDLGFNPVDGRDSLMMMDLLIPTDRYNNRSEESGASGAVSNIYNYMSAHKFKGSIPQMILNAVNQTDESGNKLAVKVFMGNTGYKVPSVKLNAAYLDNHVEKFNAKDARNKDIFGNNTTTVLPLKLR